MAQITLLRGTVAAGEGVVRLAPNWASERERWLASITEPHLSLIAVGARRIPLRDGIEHLRDWYLGANAPDWNVFARLDGSDLILQPTEDTEHGPVSKHLRLAPGHSMTLHHTSALALLCTHGAGAVARVAIQSPSTVNDGRLTPDEVFITGEAARRGVTIRNTGESDPLALLQIYCEDPS